MSSERHARIGELFLAASELPATERLEYLRAQSPNDPELIEEVRDLLAADESASVQIGSPEVTLASVLGAAERDLSQVGDYGILGLIGSGGMGLVYEVK